MASGFWQSMCLPAAATMDTISRLDPGQHGDVDDVHVGPAGKLLRRAGHDRDGEVRGDGLGLLLVDVEDGRDVQPGRPVGGQVGAA